jgi:hypothetical protein
MTVTREVRELGPRQPLSVPGKYLSLTTYRWDGTPVSTPVWFVEEEGRLFVITAADSYKAKRLRRNPAAMVAPVHGPRRSEGQRHSRGGRVPAAG